MKASRHLLAGVLLLNLEAAAVLPQNARAVPPGPVQEPSQKAAGATPSAEPALPVQAGVKDSSRALGIGDQVTFEIVEDKEVPIAKRITDTGELDVPYIGRVHATGKTCEQVASEIKRRLEAEYYYKATVKLGIDLVNVHPTAPALLGKVYVTGQVRAPGAQDLVPGEKTTVSAIIMKAGGCTQFGDSRKVKVTRKIRGGGTDSFLIDIKAVIEKGELDQDRDIREGDYVYVPQKLINW
jgi:polysaccharide export outer membrane protein